MTRRLLCIGRRMQSSRTLVLSVILRVNPRVPASRTLVPKTSAFSARSPQSANVTGACALAKTISKDSAAMLEWWCEQPGSANLYTGFGA